MRLLARVLKGHLPALAALDGFALRWGALAAIQLDCIVNGSREVGLAALSALQLVLATHAAAGTLPRPLWKTGLGVLTAAARGAAARSSAVTSRTRVELVAVAAGLYSPDGGRRSFDEDDLGALYTVLDVMLRAPLAPGEGAPAPGTLPAVQRAVLEAIPLVAPGDDHTDLWPALFGLLAGWLVPAPPPGGGDTVPPGVALAEKVVAITLKLFTSAPLVAKARSFGSVVSTLGHCMATRRTAPSAPLWRSAAAALVGAVADGLPHVNAVGLGGLESNWAAMADAYGGFLLLDSDPGMAAPGQPPSLGLSQSLKQPPSTVTPPLTLAEESPDGRADEELELAVLDSLTDAALAQCAAAGATWRSRLLSIVEAGAGSRGRTGRPPGPGDRFAQVCLRKLYVLSGRGDAAGRATYGAFSSAGEVAQAALPALVRRCGAALKRYAVDDARAAGGGGSDPSPALPRSRGDDVMCVLEVLANLTVEPAVSDALAAENASVGALLAARRARAAADGVPAGERERSHLLPLYLQLCEAVGCRDSRVRELVQGLLVLVGAELGLIAGMSFAAGE